MDTNKQKINTEGYFYPILASLNNDSKDAILEKWDKFDALPETAKYKVSSKAIADKIKGLSALFKLGIDQIDSLSGSIRSYYFGELRKEDLPFAVAKETGLELTRAKEISKAIVDKIINDRSYEESYQANHENTPVQIALKKYPEIGEQLITSDRITLKSFPSPVRPSIKNWLADYNFLMGYDRERSGIERTNYLFHNANTQKMSPAERERLSLILRSYDENYPLTVNKNTKQVVFPQTTPKPAGSPASINFRKDDVPPLRQPSGIPGRGHIDTNRPRPQAAPRFIKSTSPGPTVQPAAPQPVVHPTVRYAPRPANQPLPRQAIHQPAKHAAPASQLPRPDAPLPQGKLEIKEPPQAPKKEDGSVRFTSPHTLPFEKNQAGNLQPYKITPFSAGSNENEPEEDTKPTKNIINLKE